MVRRLVNLLFTLNASRVPLTTEQIVSDSDLGYGSGNRESDLKKFQRDRKRLADQGIAIREIHPSGASENEESSWEVAPSTYAEVGLVSQADAETLLDAVDAHLARADIPYRAPLERVRRKVLEAAGELGDDFWLEGRDGEDGAGESRDPILEAIWSGYATRRSLDVLYRDGKGAESRRTVCIYGIFTLDGHCYIVGLDNRSGAVRTFRADRVQRVWTPSKSYRVPADFDIRDYVFLPFDLAPGEGDEVSFSIPCEIPRSEIDAVTHGRGSIEESEGHLIWRVRARSVRAAVGFAFAHAHLGMRPEAPAWFKDAWNNEIEREVGSLGAK